LSKLSSVQTCIATFVTKGDTLTGVFVVVQISMDLVKGESGSCSKTRLTSAGDSGSCSKTRLTSAGDAHEDLNVKVEEGTDVEEEEIPMPIFCEVKIEQDEVSYVFVCA
jgi:hypothetical protein